MGKARLELNAIMLVEGRMFKMYDKGRHDGHTRQHQQARRHLKQGMAKVALRARVEGQPATDCVGRPLLYANEMAERHSARTLERWAKGHTILAIGTGMDFCPTCHRVPEHCRCP